MNVRSHFTRDGYGWIKQLNQQEQLLFKPISRPEPCLIISYIQCTSQELENEETKERCQINGTKERGDQSREQLEIRVSDLTKSQPRLLLPPRKGREPGEQHANEKQKKIKLKRMKIKLGEETTGK